jgi:hypothetical protein
MAAIVPTHPRDCDAKFKMLRYFLRHQELNAYTILPYVFPVKLILSKCYNMPYKRDIIHYFFYFAPFKPFLSEN